MKEATGGLATHDTSKTPGKPGRSRPGRSGPFRDLGEGASAQARQQAAAILEVLAGVRTPTQAAEALAVSLPRYYLLETRAVQGMLLACEPRRLGRQATAASALAALSRECEQLRRECTRQQALVRVAQRTVGLTAAKPMASKPGQKRRRRPTARALRAAARLQSADATPAAGPALAGAAV